ncbi:hypothetical protein A9R05_21775 [Burkholderia sp. KK1]|nr:hypothetical protein A9R05_21775 [Burkholderia sp. KK1]
MDYGLTGRRVAVIGANRGIGFDVAKAFLEQKTKLYIASENPDVMQARDRLNELADDGCEVQAVQFDIADRSQVFAAFETIGELDVLVVNSGLFSKTLPDDLSDACFDRFIKQINVNIVGHWNCVQAAVPRMKDGARIILTASIWGLVGGQEYAAYTASKHGVLGLMKSLAMDLGPRGISVNAVNPGSIGTEMNLKELSQERQAALASQMWLRPALIPPSKLVGAYLFLASDHASEITGQSISVDRGQTIAGAC